MTPAHAKALLPILQAYAEGKTIEFQAVPDGPWYALGQQTYLGDVASTPSFECVPSRYRIKKIPADPPHGSTDAHTWAQSFVEHVGHLPGIACDVGTMVGWFANAMMAEHDSACRSHLPFGFQHEDELPGGSDLHDVYDAMYAASQLGYDGKGGTRVYPYVERDGKRYYLIKLKET